MFYSFNGTNIVKKKIPITVWQKIQPLIDEHRQLFKPLKTKDFAFHLVDLDKESDFFFECAFQDEKGNFVIKYKPVSADMVSIGHTTVGLDALVEKISSWAAVLKLYVETDTFYDDPILQAYEDEFFKDLKIDEPDADTKPFDLTRQLYLDKYISTIKGLLTEYREKATDEQKLDIEDIEADCDSLRHDINIVPKNEAVKRLSVIWAKSRKYSLDLIKDILKEFRKEAVSWIAKKMIESPDGFFNTIQGLLD
jgi:hypothetical protein